MDLSSASSSCPICGWGDAGSLEELQQHLDAHSKQDMIQLLLQQQRQQQGHSVSSGGSSGSTSSRRRKSQQKSGDGDTSDAVPTPKFVLGDGVTCTLNQGLSEVPHHSRSPQVLTSPKKAGCSPKKCAMDVDKRSSSGDNVGMFSIPLPKGGRRSGDREQQGPSSSAGASTLQDSGSSGSFPPPSSNDRIMGEVHEESDNATSQTSIIQFIIENNRDQEEMEEQFILPEPYEVPAYSPFTQVHVIGRDQKNASSSRMIHVDEMSLNLSTSASGHSTVNLMTDEEIPPRGEISEYEESNTSSLISEDSKAATTSGDIKLGPLRNDLHTVVKAKSRRTAGGRRHFDIQAPGHQFLCPECPTVTPFHSLFELIGHRVKVHPSLSSQVIEGVGTPSSSVQVTVVPVRLDQPEENAAPPKEFFCVYCNVVYQSKIDLSQHMETNHADKPSNPDIFECNTCGKTFQARMNLRKHLLVHKVRKYICPTCSKGFTSNFKLMEHVRVHTKEYPYKCELCDKPYRTPSLLNYHTKTVHVPESERPIKSKVLFPCGICRKTLRSKRSFIAHAKTHRASPKKCIYCCETFSRPSVLVRHIRVSHDPQFSSSESKDCPICQKKLHPNSMIKHLRIHSNEKPFTCLVCNKQFRTYANLSSHSWSHTNGDKPYKCKECPKSYLFKRTLENHMMVHKRKTLHYVCNECGVRFTNKVNMKRHLEEHYSEKKYKCKTCGKAFQRNYYLLEHERIHSGIKPFVCNICGKASTTKSNHRAHVKIHDAREAGSQEG